MTTPSVQDAANHGTAGKKTNAVDWSLTQTLVNDEVRESIERSGGRCHGTVPDLYMQKGTSQSLLKTMEQESLQGDEHPAQVPKSTDCVTVNSPHSSEVSSVDKLVDAAVRRASQQLQQVQGNVGLPWAQKTSPTVFATYKAPPQTSPSLRVQTRRLGNAMKDVGKENRDPGHMHTTLEQRPLASRSSRLRSTFGKFATNKVSFSNAIAVTDPKHLADDDDSSNIDNGSDASASVDVGLFSKLKKLGYASKIRHADIASVSEVSMTASESLEQPFKASKAKGDDFQTMLISTIQRMVESQSRRERHMQRIMKEYMDEGQEILDGFLAECNKLFHEQDHQNQVVEQDLVNTYKAIIKGTKEFKKRILQRNSGQSSSKRSNTRRTSVFAPRARDVKAHSFR